MLYREVARKLRKMACVEVPKRSGGSHRKWQNAQTQVMAMVPDWGSKDLKTGTLKAVVKQLGLSWEEFEKA